MTDKENSYGLMVSLYDIVFGPLLRDLRKQVIATSDVKEHESVLEVACGTGEQALLYAKSGAFVTGLDLSKPMLRVARQKNERYDASVDFKHGDASNLPFEDDKFKENPEKRLSPTMNGGDLRRFSEMDFLKSNIAKSPCSFTSIHLQR